MIMLVFATDIRRVYFCRFFVLCIITYLLRYAVTFVYADNKKECKFISFMKAFAELLGINFVTG